MQLRFLRLHSQRAAQKVSYSCRAAPEHGQPQPHWEIRFLADSRDHSYAASLQGCLVSPALHSLGAWKRLLTFGEPFGECLSPPSLGWMGWMRLHTGGWGWRTSTLWSWDVARNGGTWGTSPPWKSQEGLGMEAGCTKEQPRELQALS